MPQCAQLRTDLPEWLAPAVWALADGNIEGWMALYADDAVHEFPFAEAGAVQRLQGRDAIEAYLRAVFDRVRFGTLHDIRVRQAGPETIVEATGHHETRPDGHPIRIAYVWIITRQNSSVTSIRDYMGRRPVDA